MPFLGGTDYVIAWIFFAEDWIEKISIEARTEQ